MLVVLGETGPAQEIQQYGIELLQQLINQPTRSDENKKQLNLKFAGLQQLGVDLAVNAGDLVEAWETAEMGKNNCLNSLLFAKNEHINSPKYSSIQQLLNPSTVVIYWHISPSSLQTFIIKDQAPSPILLFTPIKDLEAVPEGVERLIRFENWLQNWQEQYQEYHHQYQESGDKINHSWRFGMEKSLLELKEILNISTIIQELEGITNLILIPHRDLCRLPLQALFHISYGDNLPISQSNYTITYLPSVEIGLSFKIQSLSNWQHQKFFSVEHPNLTTFSEFTYSQFAVEVISKMFINKHRIEGLQSTKENVHKCLLADYNVFHFAGDYHGNEAQNPKLLLAKDEEMTIAEISQQSLINFNLVTLTGCEISQTNNEYLGLDTSFIIAGVPYVVSTIWNVESSAGALVMIEFYRRLHTNKPPIIALAEATTWLREITAGELIKWYEDLLNNLHPDELKIRNYLTKQLYKIGDLEADKKPYNHPYYWGAFIITGKPI